MKNRRVVGLLNPIRDKNRRQEPGGRRDDAYDHGLSRSWKVDVCEGKKKKSHSCEWLKPGWENVGTTPPPCQFGRLESSEKTVAILGDKWWPQTAKHDDDRISKHFLCSMWKRRSERRNVGDVSIGSRNSALRLEGMRGQWSND